MGKYKIAFSALVCTIIQPSIDLLNNTLFFTAFHFKANTSLRKGSYSRLR
jgi:hypothetical protein